MTNHWNDIANSDCMIAIGSNPAENHPASFGHITQAQERGAKLISVDPRFTRTSARADIYAPMRSGTDVAFIGGMIKYIIDDMEQNTNDYNMTYVIEYTNAPYLINPDFKGSADLDGLFSGYNSETRSYDKSSWTYQLENGIPKKDKTLQDPNCVFQLLKKQFNRYDPDTVSSVTGTPKAKLLEIYDLYSDTGKPGKAGTIMYAMGTTQHTNGTQMIRSYAILQLLLANVGVAGGGINALRGESNVQGSTDMCLLWHILPGYLKQPDDTEVTLSKHLEAKGPTYDPLSANWWGYYIPFGEPKDPWKSNYSKYVVSLLKAWYGDSATADNEFAYHNLPKVDKGVNYSWIALFESMLAGYVKGLMAWGQNPSVCGPNANMTRAALSKLDWLVCVDLWETETAAFWKPEAGVNPADIQTEVFMLPAVCSYEKEGSVTNSGRWMQWRYKAVDGPGDSLPDLDILNDLMSRIRGLYQAEGGQNPKSITDLTWNYGTHPDPKEVAKEVNGYDLTTGKLMASFGALKNNGDTTSGNWLYCNSYVEPDLEPDAPIPGNRASRRITDDGPFNIGLHSKWAWCWPVNRRIIYNRASVDLTGQPWDEEHPVIKYQGPIENGKYVDKAADSWKGDVPDGGWYPMKNPDGTDRTDTRYPFIMKPEGHSRIFGAGRVDGPFPEHYEPWESPVSNPLSGTQNDPAFKIWAGPMDHKGSSNDYPIVCTTFRLVEHWQAGQMTRNLPWIVELQPEAFVEISEELAEERDIDNGEFVIVSSARGSVRVKAMVTKRLKPMQVSGKTVHEVALPWHWGFKGLSTGDSANILTPNVGDANTMIPEFKAFLVNISKA
jgi:formate dehydrogenase major subunit